MSAGLGCARCGDCCENILMRAEFDPLNYDRPDLSEADLATLAFTAVNWARQGPAEAEGWAVWSCKAFDPIERLCTAHEARPPVCSNYPWYGREPDAGTISNPRCSYLLDLTPEARPAGARPLIPLTVL